jgi:hypothetical protein
MQRFRTWIVPSTNETAATAHFAVQVSSAAHVLLFLGLSSFLWAGWRDELIDKVRSLQVEYLQYPTGVCSNSSNDRGVVEPQNGAQPTGYLHSRTSHAWAADQPERAQLASTAQGE